MKVKIKRAPKLRKVTSAVLRAVKKAKRATAPPKLALVKAKVIAVRTRKKPSLPGKAAVLVALKKKQSAARLEEQRRAEAVAAPAFSTPEGTITPVAFEG